MSAYAVKSKGLLLLAFVVLMLGTGCATTTVVDVTSKPAVKATDNLSEDQLLDIGIELFDPGVPEDEKVAKRLFIKESVRNAEASYIPYVLRKVLEDTENWGAVRIIPRATNAVDLRVSGRIIKSDGEVLSVRIKATDATGQLWLDKKYTDAATGMSYNEEIAKKEEPFLDLYNNIANDLLALRQQFTAKQLERVRTVAKLRFAAEISPYAFSDYYQVNKKGQIAITRLPSQDDPMLNRIDKIRDREYAFIDLLDENYEGFHDDMTQPYADWRRYSLEETIALREQRSSAFWTAAAGVALGVAGAVAANKSENRSGRTAGNAAVYGGINLIKGGLDLAKEAKIHSEALGELGESFGQEVQPILVEVEGRTVELSGSADQQFEEWRTLLKNIYQSETGLVVAASSLPKAEHKLPERLRQQIPKLDEQGSSAPKQMTSEQIQSDQYESAPEVVTSEQSQSGEIVDPFADSDSLLETEASGGSAAEPEAEFADDNSSH